MNATLNIASPITNGPAVVVGTVDAKKIIDLYGQSKLAVADYFKGLLQVSIYQCVATGYRFYYPASVMGDEAFYKKLSEKNDYTRGWEFDHQFAYDRINNGDHVLEIGCGNGSFLQKILREKTPHAAGLELNKEMVLICQQKNLPVKHELLSEHKRLNQAKYDVICAFQVLEHINDVAVFMKDMIACLKPGGKLILSTPNNDPYYMGYNKLETFNLPPHHIGLWNESAYKKVIQHLGLRLKAVRYSETPSFKGIVYQKARQICNASISSKGLLFYASLVYATVYYFFVKSFKPYKGTYLVVEITTAS